MNFKLAVSFPIYIVLPSHKRNKQSYDVGQLL